MTKLLIGNNLKLETIKLAQGLEINWLEEYTINAVRGWQKKLSFKGPKAGIVLEADKLSVPAQNALLKILEEPPSNTIIILTAYSQFALLPTIVSRCQIIRFQQELEDSELISWRDKLIKNPNQKNLYAVKEIIATKNLINNININKKLAEENLNLKLYGRIYK